MLHGSLKGKWGKGSCVWKRGLLRFPGLYEKGLPNPAMFRHVSMVLPKLTILQKYVLRELLGPTALGLLVFTFVFLIGNLFKLAELIFKEGSSAHMAAELILTLLPGILSLTIPMAVLTGILMGIGRLAADREILAIRMSGVNLFKICAPVLGVAALIAIFMMWANQRIVPYLTLKSQDIGMQLAFKELSSIEPDRTYDLESGRGGFSSTFYYDHRNSKTNEMMNVTIKSELPKDHEQQQGPGQNPQQQGGKNPQQQGGQKAQSPARQAGGGGATESAAGGKDKKAYAKGDRKAAASKTGSNEKGGKDAKASAAADDEEDAPSKSAGSDKKKSDTKGKAVAKQTDAEKKAIQDAEDKRRMASNTLIIAERGTITADIPGRIIMLNLTTGTLNVVNADRPGAYDIFAFDKFQKGIRPNFLKTEDGAMTLTPREMSSSELRSIARHMPGKAGSKFRVEYWQRFSIPMACLAFALVAIPLAVYVRPTAKAVAFGISFLLILIYYGLEQYGASLGKTGNSFAPFAIFFPNIVLAIVGTVLLKRMVLK